MLKATLGGTPQHGITDLIHGDRMRTNSSKTLFLVWSCVIFRWFAKDEKAMKRVLCLCSVLPAGSLSISISIGNSLRKYYFEAGEYENVIAPATVAAMVIDLQHAIKYSYLYFILGASREYKIRKEGTTFSEENIRPIYRAYYASLVYTERTDAPRMENIEKRIRVLEYDSGINSNINFSEFNL